MMSQRRTPLRSALPRAWAVVAAVLCFITQLGGLAHHLLVGHTVCPEHGELVHDGEEHGERLHDGRAGNAPVDDDARAASPSLGRLDALEDEHDHDHCTRGGDRGRRVDGVSRVGRLLGPEVGTPPFETPAVAPLPVTAPPSLTRTERLLLAPKSSPPSARHPLGRHA